MQNTIQQAEARAAAMRASWTGDAIVTPKGAALAALHRFTKVLRTLPAADRAEVLAIFAGELRDVIAGLAHGA